MSVCGLKEKIKILILTKMTMQCISVFRAESNYLRFLDKPQSIMLSIIIDLR
jgi:hypothetical protein